MYNIPTNSDTFYFVMLIVAGHLSSEGRVGECEVYRIVFVCI